MIKNKIGIGTIFAAMLLVSIAFVPAVMAEPMTKTVDGTKMIVDINGKVTPQSSVGVAGETACDLLTAALWTLDQYVDDSRIGQAETVLAQGADAFRNNQLTTGFNKLKQGVTISISLASYWGPQLAAWVYNKLIDAINYVKDFLHQYGYW